jgi:hypothetical protein
MASLIENLMGAGMPRKDKKRMEIFVRPLPVRARELFDVFSSMGRTASLQGLHRGIELKDRDPKLVTFAFLGRWATAAELDALPKPYDVNRHVTSLVISEEFRTFIMRRMFDAFAEKKRILLIRIPRSAGVHAIQMISDNHPFIPVDLNDPRFSKPQTFIPTLGLLTERLGSARTVSTASPNMVAFTHPPASQCLGEDPISWHYIPPVCRPDDLMFAIVRPPHALAISQVNGALTTLRAGHSAAGLAEQLAENGRLPAMDDVRAWRALGRTLLPRLVAQNPLCNALGTGTAESAFAACALSPVHLVALDGYDGWARIALEAPLPGPLNVSEPILRDEDLTPADRDLITARTAEDEIFHAKFKAKQEAGGLPAVRGWAL